MAGIRLADFNTLDELIRAMEYSGYSVKKDGEKFKGPALDEKHFRRMDKFEGDVGKFRSWIFDLEVALGSIDSELGKVVKALLRENIPDPSEANMDQNLDQDTQDKYSTELYGVICGLTSGEAKKIVRSISEKHNMQCGFSALVALNNRFDARTPGNLLTAVMAAMSPPAVKQTAGIPKAILDWEEKLNALGNIHNETISENIKMGILISMLPKEYQDLCFGIGGASGAKRYTPISGTTW
jgi:hypothetical protein